MQANYCPYCHEVRITLEITDAYMIPGNLIDDLADDPEDLNAILADDSCKRVYGYACPVCNKSFYVLED